VTELAEVGPGRLALRGALDFRTARTIHARGAQVLAAGAASSWTIDLDALTGCDSAALAVLLDWLAIANRAGHTLQFVAIPERVLAIARISEVDELLEAGV
jgi:phospholipid transport system transporter-binding protein